MRVRLCFPRVSAGVCSSLIPIQPVCNDLIGIDPRAFRVKIPKHLHGGVIGVIFALAQFPQRSVGS